MEFNKTITWRFTPKSNYYEHILLIVVAGIGLAGSLFVFSECPDAKISSVHTGSINQTAVLSTDANKATLDQWVKISGKEINNDLISTIGTYDLAIENDKSLATSK